MSTIDWNVVERNSKFIIESEAYGQQELYFYSFKVGYDGMFVYFTKYPHSPDMLIWSETGYVFKYEEYNDNWRAYEVSW